ncbi:hypothetical protein [Tautonia plasticadhaerens]|uniref:Uncharacterized protein n=1 Tax=Tautonia plasticadhaerens TaxID=2527974 RepID=A0A518H6A3_9BACT|nr:hypothetical protein [Tautonia plasticadhaerens]QDV36359.1 hypothetical protein ElP_42790 [Tautonia plasticadhaerens]
MSSSSRPRHRSRARRALARLVNDPDERPWFLLNTGLLMVGLIGLIAEILLWQVAIRLQ